MDNIKTLLAATDFSEDAHQAALRAAFLAKEHGARLELLHVMNSSSFNHLRELFNLPGDIDAKLIDDARSMLGELAEDIAKKIGVAVVPRVQIGQVVNEIISAADTADMLILGARGLSPLRDIFLGTTAENLLRKCKRPVLVSKCPPHGEYRRVMVPVDLSHCSMGSLHRAAWLAPQASITIVHAFDVPFEGKLWLAGVGEKEIQHYRAQARLKAQDQIETLMQSLGNTSLRLHQVVKHGDAARTILEQEEISSPDLIVIGKHRRPIMGELLLGSVTRHVLSYAKCDVLVVGE